MLKLINFIMKYKNLCKCIIGKEYLICDLTLSDEKILKHLENLFIKKGAKITVKHKSYGDRAYIIKSLGINYAIEKKICENILVYDT